MKLIEKNTPYTHSFLSLYAKRNIRYLSIEKDKYIQYLEHSVAQLLKSFKKNIDKPEIAFPLQIKAASIIQQYARTVGVSDSVEELIPLVIQTTSKVVHKHWDLIKLLEMFPAVDKDSAEQSVLCLYLCHFTYKFMGWQSELVFQRLCLASLLQDCAITNDKMYTVNKLDETSFTSASEADQIEFKEHPNRASEIANQFNSIPNIDFIIAEHHEMPDASGFPRRLNATKMTVISCLFNYVSHFARTIVDVGLDEENIITVFKNSQTIYDTGNFKQPLEAFGSALKQRE
jgi:HD-GYP domain-containing protein (c-di-GMP phosphodiesterase class II)